MGNLIDEQTWKNATIDYKTYTNLSKILTQLEVSLLNVKMLLLTDRRWIMRIINRRKDSY